MADAKPHWRGALLKELQGPSSLGMAVSGGAVGFSASIIDPAAHVGFWTSMAFQLTVGFQFLSVVFGVKLGPGNLPTSADTQSMRRSFCSLPAGCRFSG